jgi:hypothetical protein
MERRTAIHKAVWNRHIFNGTVIIFLPVHKHLCRSLGPLRVTGRHTLSDVPRGIAQRK